MNVQSARSDIDDPEDAAGPATEPPRIFSRAVWRQALRPGAIDASEALDLRALPQVLPRILRLQAPYRWRIALALLAAIAAAVFAVLLPKLMGRAVDQANLLLQDAGGHAAAASDALWLTAGLLIGASALRGLLTMVSGFQFELVGQRFARDLRLAYYEKLQWLDFAFHDGVHSGDLITRGMLDLEGVRMFVEGGLQRIVTLALLLVVGATLMIFTDPLMALLALSFVPFTLWRAVNTGFLLRLTWTALQRRMSTLTRTIEENLQGIRVVRAFAAGRFETAKFDAAARDALQLANERIATRTGAVSLMTLAFYLAMALVLGVGGHRVMAGRMTVGHLTEFLTFMTILQAPVRQIMMVVNTLARAVSSGSRLFEILDRDSTVQEAAAAPDLVPGEGTLRFEDVGFRYGSDPAAPAVLSGISFEVAKGRTLGIIGAPGSGKSTLALLIPRFYDVSSGRITIDGQDIRAVSLASLRRAVGLVQQDVFLFDMTLGDNIAYSDPDAADPHIRAAAEAAQVHSHIAALPDQYGSPAGERGVSLSGGQRQRLSIARGVIAGPPVVVLDDSTSAIDVATEARLRAALQETARDRVTIIVAHRLSALMHADEIIVLEEGRIAERGDHAGLLAHGGIYAELYRMQSHAAAPPPPTTRHLEQTAP